MANIIVLGAGLVGSVMAKDLSTQHNVTSVDIDKENLKKQVLKYLDIFKDHPYIFNLGHGILPETNPEMVECLVNTVRGY